MRCLWEGPCSTTGRKHMRMPLLVATHARTLRGSGGKLNWKMSWKRGQQDGKVPLTKSSKSIVSIIEHWGSLRLWQFQFSTRHCLQWIGICRPCAMLRFIRCLQASERSEASNAGHQETASLRGIKLISPMQSAKTILAGEPWLTSGPCCNRYWWEYDYAYVTRLCRR